MAGHDDIVPVLLAAVFDFLLIETLEACLHSGKNFIGGQPGAVTQPLLDD